MSEATEPVLFDHKLLTQPVMLTRDDIMERRILLVVTFMEEASWFACTLRSGDYGDLLEWIVYRSAAMLHAFVSIPPGMPVANALLVHFLIHHGAKIALYIPGRTAISINGAGEISVQAIADIFSPRRRTIYPKPASRNVLMERTIFSDRYMAHIYLAQRFREWKTIKLQFYHDGATHNNVQNIKHVHSIRRNDVDGQNNTPWKLGKEHRQRSLKTQDIWEFYNYYPQVVSLLGIKQERGRRNTVVSSEYRLEDEDKHSCNDSGIDIPTSQIHARAVQDTFDDNTPLRSGRNTAHTASSVRWSVDEMIALSLLEAMELRNYNAKDDAGRARANTITRTRSNKSFRRAIAKFFQKYFALGKA